MYYEIYQLTGKWIGASAIHGQPDENTPKPALPHSDN
jgi:hypothetical protein